MSVLPKVLASSVIRSSVQGESHGGVYIVDLENGSWEQKLDWNSPDISWEGRGWDRGLRGIAFYDENIYLAASDEIFVYDQYFQLISSHRNHYLKHCHEIFICDHYLYVTSTGFDSILIFDLLKNYFVEAIAVTPDHAGATITRYDPNSNNGPRASRECHLNSVHVEGGIIYVCGTRLNKLLTICGNQVNVYARLPFVTHNARPFEQGLLLADTGSDQIAIMDRDSNYLEVYPVIHYPESELSWTHLSNDRARQGFARGLCLTSTGMIVAGSSPSTITVYHRKNTLPLTTVKITDDIRNSIHGLELWPY